MPPPVLNSEVLHKLQAEEANAVRSVGSSSIELVPLTHVPELWAIFDCFVCCRSHVGAVCRTFTDASARRLVSGGNDRCLYLWQLGSDPDVDDCSTASWQHSRKVNALALSGGHMYIADTSKNISIYDFEQICRSGGAAVG